MPTSAENPTARKTQATGICVGHFASTDTMNVPINPKHHADDSADGG